VGVVVRTLKDVALWAGEVHVVQLKVSVMITVCDPLELVSFVE